MAAQDYVAAFAGKGPLHAEPFLNYYRKGPDGELDVRTLTRADFFNLAKRAAAVLSSLGVGDGDYIAHYFSANDPNDLVFRVAATFIGAIPVTVNWQADSYSRILYKLQTTKAKVVVVDVETPADSIARLKQDTTAHFIVASEAIAAAKSNEFEESSIHQNIATTHPRIVIFTSGTTGNPKGVKLTYKNYRTNRRTFEQFLQVHPEEVRWNMCAKSVRLLSSTTVDNVPASLVGDIASRCREPAAPHKLDRYHGLGSPPPRHRPAPLPGLHDEVLARFAWPWRTVV